MQNFRVHTNVQYFVRTAANSLIQAKDIQRLDQRNLLKKTSWLSCKITQLVAWSTKKTRSAAASFYTRSYRRPTLHIKMQFLRGYGHFRVACFRLVKAIHLMAPSFSNSTHSHWSASARLWDACVSTSQQNQKDDQDAFSSLLHGYVKKS